MECCYTKSVGNHEIHVKCGNRTSKENIIDALVINRVLELDLAPNNSKVPNFTCEMN